MRRMTMKTEWAQLLVTSSAAACTPSSSFSSCLFSMRRAPSSGSLSSYLSPHLPLDPQSAMTSSQVSGLFSHHPKEAAYKRVPSAGKYIHGPMSFPKRDRSLRFCEVFLGNHVHS